MSALEVLYVPSESVSTQDPKHRPCVIIGKLQNIQKTKFEQISKFVAPRVTEETWKDAVQSLSVSSSCSLWLNKAVLVKLPSDASRHNTPSRSHSLTKSVLSHKPPGIVNTLYIVICERSEAYASGCAVARAYPKYQMASSSGMSIAMLQEITVSFLFIGDNSQPLSDEECRCLKESASAIRLTQYIVDAPCNEMHTDGFIEQVKKVGNELSIAPTIIRGDELDKKGFGGIFGVGKAAVHPPALVILSHTPSGATKNIAWVGKGIVYDTGGLSIKTKEGMPGMKRDCGGAAGILGAFYAAVKMGFTQNLHAVFCLAENAVGPIATRPDDIHRLYSGKTVEINNTDAEGRLVLGDGVAYARRNLKADVVVDMATLTGAQGISTGKYHGAILSNNDDIERSCMDAGRTCGDLVFPIPYCPELHFSEFNSSVADMKNSVASRFNAQSSCAGLFIGSHLGFDYKGVWLHIDMAAPVYSGERATGYGVALLNTLFGSLSSNNLLRNISPKLAI